MLEVEREPFIYQIHTELPTLIQGNNTREGEGTEQDTQTDRDPVGVGCVVLAPLCRHQQTTQLLKPNNIHTCTYCSVEIIIYYKL